MHAVKYIIFAKFSNVQFNSDNLIIASSNLSFFFFQAEFADIEKSLYKHVFNAKIRLFRTY
jgi:hypothetical protein